MAVFSEENTFPLNFLSLSLVGVIGESLESVCISLFAASFGCLLNRGVVENDLDGSRKTMIKLSQGISWIPELQ